MLNWQLGGQLDHSPRITMEGGRVCHYGRGCDPRELTLPLWAAPNCRANQLLLSLNFPFKACGQREMEPAQLLALLGPDLLFLALSFPFVFLDFFWGF